MQILDPRDALEDFILHFMRLGVRNQGEIIDHFLKIAREMVKSLPVKASARLIGSIAMSGGPKPFAIQAIGRAVAILSAEEIARNQ